MFRKFTGVLTKTSKGFILYSHKSEININEELESLWKVESPVHITITSSSRSLLNEKGCEIYKNRADKTKKYTFHINDIDIEQVLENAINKQLYITIEYTLLLSREEKTDDTRICKS